MSVRAFPITAFRQVLTPLDRPLTKFGGQPFWIDEPAWPVSSGDGLPMTFIGQILLDSTLHPAGVGRLVYLFMDDDWFETMDSLSGCAAVVVQGGGRSGNTVPSATGPALEFADVSEFPEVDPSGPCEFTIEVAEVAEPDYIPAERAVDLGDEYDAYCDRLSTTKLGGVPRWIQHEEFPFEPSHLVCQLEDNVLPFYANFGTGYGYLFVDSTAREGRFLIQC